MLGAYTVLVLTLARSRLPKSEERRAKSGERRADRARARDPEVNRDASSAKPLSRVRMREQAPAGFLPGVTKSSS